MASRYGAPLYRVCIDPGFGCPNRKPDGTGGCAFCSGDGSRAKQTLGAVEIESQIEAGMKFAAARYGARRFMAYVQAYTGTNAPVDEQRRLYERIMACHAFDALSIGTRPDCLPAPVLDLLTEISEKTDLWIELGAQTVHDRTLRRLGRGHDWSACADAIISLDERGIKVVSHVILGLPGEDAGDFAATAEAMASMPLSGIKIHNLHVVRGSALAAEYAKTPFKVYDEREYAGILVDFLRRLPPDLPIMRINTDTPSDELLAPVWKLSKAGFRLLVEDTMRGSGLAQGDLRGAVRRGATPRP